MKILTFKHGFRNQKEINFIFGRFQLRIGTHQIAFWNNHSAIVNLQF